MAGSHPEKDAILRITCKMLGPKLCYKWLIKNGIEIQQSYGTDLWNTNSWLKNPTMTSLLGNKTKRLGDMPFFSYLPILNVHFPP